MNGFSGLRITLILITSASLLFPQPARSLKNSSYAYLKSNLEFLASDELEGREATSRGEKIAALYISEELEKYGVLPYGDSGTYFQDFNMIVTNFTEESAVTFYGENENSSFQNSTNVVYSPRRFPAEKFNKMEYEIVFVGYGVFSEEDNYDSYENIDVKNKVVLVLSGTPKIDDEDILNKSAVEKYRGSRSAKADLAKSNGAVGLIVLPDEKILIYWNYYIKWATSKSFKLNEEFNPDSRKNNIPILMLNEEASTVLLKSEIQDFESIKSNQLPNPKTFALKTKLKFEYEVNQENKIARNIIGLIEGNDKTIKNEYVTLGAHYDHEGIKDGKIYNGADDNGSGTVTILEVARRLAANRNNRRPILIIFHTAEEKGLKGAKYLANNTTFIDSAIVHINIDMVGRKSEDSIFCIGANKISSELGDLVEEVNSQTTNFILDYKFDDPDDPQRLYYRSDHVHYAKRGIPIVFFYDHMNVDYHKPTDTVDKINFIKLLRMTDLVFNLSVRISNLDEKLKKDNFSEN